MFFCRFKTTPTLHVQSNTHFQHTYIPTVICLKKKVGQLLFQNLRRDFDWDLETIKSFNLVKKRGNPRFVPILAQIEGVVATTIQIETKLRDHPYSCSIRIRFCEKKVGQLFF